MLIAKRARIFLLFGLVLAGLIFAGRVTAETADVDLSTLAISEEQGGNTTAIVPDENHFSTNFGESHFSTSPANLGGSNSSDEGNFHTPPAVSSSTTTEVSTEDNFQTAKPSDGGGGNGGGGGGGSTGGGGGSSGGSSGGRRQIMAAVPVAPVFPSGVCQPFLTKFIKLGAKNDPLEVFKLQFFLRYYERFSQVPLTGFYDRTTYLAVRQFQERYAKDVLRPWGINEPTGYVFITTLLAVNNVYCERSTANQLDLRHFYPDYTSRASAGRLSAPENNTHLAPMASSSLSFIGPADRSIWRQSQAALVGLVNIFHNNWWRLILVFIFLLLLFYLWFSERGDDPDSLP